MDNQQERLENENDKSWFVAMLEAEGNICLVRSKRIEKSLEIFRYVPSISITNTDFEIIKECERILTKNNISFGTYKRKRQNAKICWDIHVNGMKRASSFLTWILPYIRGEKKHRAKKILDFCMIRINRCKGNFHGIPYTEDELKLCQEIKAYSLKSSTTTRQTPKGDDIV